MNKFVAPCGINHLLLNVRDIKESHRFRLDIPKADSRLRPQRVVSDHRRRADSGHAQPSGLRLILPQMSFSVSVREGDGTKGSPINRKREDVGP